MANQWFKFYGAEFMSDPKIGRLSAAERSCWLTILCMASQTNGVIEYLTVDDLLSKSGIKWNPYDEGDWEKCQGILIKFAQLKMIKVSQDESCVEVLNWEKRQETALTAAERQAKYRENKKSNENVTERVTKVTLEENRIEKKEEENSKEFSPLLKEEKIQIVADEESKSPNRKKDKKAMDLREKLYRIFEEEKGVRPTPNTGDYVRVVEALKVLTQDEIIDMVEDLVSSPDVVTVKGALSNYKIEKYRQENA
jgi:hypothetical protein